VKSRIFFKLLGAFLVVILTATLALDVAIRRAWEDSLQNELERALREKTLLFALRVESDKAISPQQMAAEAARAANARATIIERSGKVIADSEADPATMENHAGRPEVTAALRGEVGTAVRLSHTRGLEFLYVAAPIPNGAVRLAYPLAAIQQAREQVRGTLLMASALALVLAMVLAGLAAQSISRRLRRITRFAEQVAEGDLLARVAESGSDEIAQVASALDRTAQKLEQNFGELEQRRQQMETLLNSMEEPVVAVSQAGTVQWANGAMQDLTGGRARQGAALVELLRDPDFLAAVRGALDQRATATARVRSAVPGRVFDLTVAPMPAGAVAVLHDLTEIERVEKTRRDFIANVSHELRTPLTSIQGYAETLADSLPANGHAREFVDVIRRNAELMARLTEDLLVLARVESGEQKLEMESVPARELLEDALDAFGEEAKAGGVDLAVADWSDQAVEVDRDALQQVFGNLIANALKYAASGGRIQLGARPADGHVEFYVRDFGPGIASEHVPRLFERFYRVDKARSREGGGTGLGLAIVKHIVLNHGGTVRAESELGHGSTFLFTLPQAARPQTAA
jgi:two-component system phosphate regulon sensor histidine kinase PhoR